MSMEAPQPTREHAWLTRFVGEWKYEQECVMGPGQPAQTFTGEETVRAMGGLWILCEGRGTGPGLATTLFTLGYDPARERFVGSFIASIMTHLWVYSGGQLDAAGRVLTLDAEGPSFTGVGVARYQDSIEAPSPDLRILRSQVLGEDGKWTEFMKATYRRVGGAR